MKKLLSVAAVCLSMFLSAYAAEPTVAHQYQNGATYTSVGLTGDGEYAIIDVTKKGNDAVYTVYNSDLSVDRTFTIKGAYTFSIEIANNLDDVDAAHPDYSFPARCYELWNYHDHRILAVQNLEGKNDKWYVLIDNKTYEKVHVDYGDGDYDYGTYETKSTNVYDETGNLVGTIPYGESSIQIYKGSDGKRYLVTDGVADSEECDLMDVETDGSTGYNKYVTYFWDLSGASGVAVPMATGTRTSRAYPNPLHQGRDFTIELSEIASEGTRVVVADMNGAVIYNRPVKAGAEKIMIPARELRYGNMVYSVICGDELLEKGKILVR